MKKYIKPEISMIELRTDERLACCNMPGEERGYDGCGRRRRRGGFFGGFFNMGCTPGPGGYDDSGPIFQNASES